MSSSIEPAQPLQLDDYRRIEAICTDFEATWTGIEQDFARLLRDTSGSLRAELFCELVKIDIELRRRLGEVPSPTDYSPKQFDVNVALVTDDFWRYVSEEKSDDTVPSFNSDRYEILERLGVGGIGVVYRAYDRQNQRPVAIKLLHSRHAGDSEAASRFALEGLLTGKLQHPGIPPIYDRGTLADGTHFFSMKVIEGDTLEKTLGAREDLKNHGDLIQVFEKIAQTVAYAHARGVIHRDLKPQNVMVGSFGEVQVMDWGLAKRFDVGSDPATMGRNDHNGAMVGSLEGDSDGLTSAGDFIGTPRYMSPEQSRGELNSHTPKTDVFGLGTILYQILTGETLFPGDSVRSALAKTQRGELNDAYDALSRLTSTDTLVVLCRQCLALDPADRPSMADVAAQSQLYLAELQRQLTMVEIDRSKAQVQRDEAWKRTRWITTISLISLIAVTTAAIATWNQWRKARTSADQERQAKLIAEREAKSVRDINGFLTNILSATRPDVQGREVTHRQVIEKAIPELEGRFADQPHVEGELRLTLGETFRWLDRIDVAEEQLRLSIDAFQRADPIDELKLMEAKGRLAGVLLDHDRSQDQPEAIRLRRELLKQSRAIFGDADRHTVTALVGLAEVLTYNSAHDEASGLLDEAIATVKNTESLDRFDTTKLMLTMARVRKHQDRYGEAEAIYKTILNAPDVSPLIRMPAMKQLGEMYLWDEKPDLAVVTLRQAFELHEMELGMENRFTLSTMRKYFRALNAAGEYEEFLKLADDGIRRHEEWDGLARSSVMEVRSMKARAYEGTGDRENAESILRESIKLAEEHRGVGSKQAKRAIADLKAYQEGRNWTRDYD